MRNSGRVPKYSIRLEGSTKFEVEEASAELERTESTDSDLYWKEFSERMPSAEDVFSFLSSSIEVGDRVEFHLIFVSFSRGIHLISCQCL